MTPEAFAQHNLILDGVSWTDRKVREWFRTAGIEPRPKMELNYIEAIKNVVAAGLGVSILPACVLAEKQREKDLVLRDLAPAITRPMVLVERRDKPNDAALGIVRSAILENCGDIISNYARSW